MLKKYKIFLKNLSSEPWQKRLLNLESENTTNKATQSASSEKTTNSGQMDLLPWKKKFLLPLTKTSAISK